MQTSGAFEYPIKQLSLLGRKTPLVVVLITPSLVTLFEDGNSFIPNLLRRVFPAAEVGRVIDVLAAVVDRIPSIAGHVLVDQDSDGPEQEQTMGSEGVSIMIRGSESTAPDLWHPRNETTPEPETMSIQQRCALSFRFLPPGRSLSRAPNKSRRPRSSTSYDLELPLANTLFQNGRTSTLEAQRWVVTKFLNSTPEFLRTEQSTLPGQTLHIDDGESHVINMDIPLIPLTAPRIVANSLGNILRRFRKDDAPENTVPASEELEKVVSSVAGTKSQSPGRLEVWALVTPREYWISRPRKDSLLATKLENGARLHKVLSGGGGWGNKQGLLSLDPDSTFTKISSKSQHSFGNGYDLETEERETLGEVVRPGDVVQFFRQITSTTARLVEVKSTECLKVSTVVSTMLGCLPSTIDTMRHSAIEETDVTGQARYLFAHNHFGAMSEQGLSLSIETHGDEGSTSVGSQLLGHVVQTKLPPYSLFSSIRPLYPPAFLNPVRHQIGKGLAAARTAPDAQIPVEQPKHVVAGTSPAGTHDARYGALVRATRQLKYAQKRRQDPKASSSRTEDDLLIQGDSAMLELSPAGTTLSQEGSSTILEPETSAKVAVVMSEPTSYFEEPQANPQRQDVRIRKVFAQSDKHLTGGGIQARSAGAKSNEDIALPLSQQTMNMVSRLNAWDRRS
ncbi:hypothetical protein MMC24_003012 [Lignoscripta atroalba]|nr:hypothetical protein [Lignoscripta atroalba]